MRMAKDGEGVRMNDDGSGGRFTIQTADVAVGFVEAHQAMNVGDGREAAIDGLVGGSLSEATDADFDNRS